MKHLVALVGPTAAGKTRVALAAAARTGATIVSVDSVQAYRGMDIGAAKPSAGERRQIEHRMIDVVEPCVDFTVAEFQAMARSEIESIPGPVLLVGGSGLHFRAVIDPLEFPPTAPSVRAELEQMPLEALVTELSAADPEAADVIDLANPRRVIRAVEIWRLTGATPSQRSASAGAEAVRSYRALYPTVVFGLDPGRPLAQAVKTRVEEMRDRGFMEEVERLAPTLGRLAAQAVGYRELLEVVAGRATIDQAFVAVERATWRLVKRQRTFFSRDPRIRWEDQPDALVGTLIRALEGAEE